MRFFLVVALAIVAAGLANGLRRDGRNPGAALRIAFISGNRLEEIDLAGGHRRTLNATADGSTPLPDGSRVVNVAGRIVHVDRRGRRLADLGPGVLPAVSPDGRRIAVATPSGDLREGSQLWIVNADGSGRRQLTSGAYDTLPEWSPDGSTVLFTRSIEPAVTATAAKAWVEAVPAGGGTPLRLTSSGYDGGGSYSPDGRTIAFGSGRDRAGKLCGEDECIYRSQLYVMRSDGSGERRVAQDFVGAPAPVFASNTTIVYSRAAASSFASELYRIDVDGSCRLRLTHDALDDVLPVIVPAPSRGELPCPPTQKALPPGGNFNSAASTLTPERARAWRGLPLYWLGTTAGPFVLSSISVQPITPPGRPASQTAYVTYACLPASGGDCARSLSLIMTPVCARPTFPATGRGAIGRARGVTRIRYFDRDELLAGRTIITIYGDVATRELAARELRSLSRSAGTVAAGQPLPATPAGILGGLPCQPPAVSHP